jgi:hypothetical protein
MYHRASPRTQDLAREFEKSRPDTGRCWWSHPVFAREQALAADSDWLIDDAVQGQAAGERAAAVGRASRREDLVMSARLRVFPLSRDEDEAGPQEPTLHVRLGDLLPLVALAARHNYLWLQDFLDDEVVITTDLYEVLRAFRCSRPSA